jgi:dihydrolipoamide dehydrogenase
MSFKRRGIRVLLKTSVSGMTKSDSSVSIQLSSGENISAEKVLIAVGRARNTQDLGLDQAGVTIRGDAVEVNEFLETSVKGIYAIGDVTALPQLAHAASFSGTLVVDNLISPQNKRPFPRHAVPNCIFSDPLVASVGLTREAAERNGMSVKEVRTLLSSEGKARVEGELEGFVKLVVNEKDGQLIGGHIFGGEASEMIGVLCVAVSEHMTVERLSQIIFPHPTYHELIGSAARH